jgi:hypothetical protein
MKRVALAALLALSACESSNEYGQCVGIQDAHPGYRVSVRNVVLGSLFLGTVFAPALAMFAEFYCPTASKGN